jgi:hypothetical protein
MLDQLAAAFERRDYQLASALLKQFQQQQPDSPWVKLYGGKLREVAGKLDTAAVIYREVLQETANSKVAAQARQGLQRVTDLLKAAKQQQKEQQIAEATANPGNMSPGVLVLEAVPERRQAAAQQFGQIMNLDAYTARMLLPSRGWRLYRVGAIGELQVYGQALRQAEVPAFWLPLTAVEAIRLFRVHYLEAVSPVTAICENESGQIGSLTFDWAEVVQRVEGRLPVFEDVVDIDARNQLTRKEKTQDYAQVIDLHMPSRNSILRLGDWNYQFQQGVVFDARQDGEIPMMQVTNRIQWNQLVSFLDDRLVEAPVWTDFSLFAETAFDHLSLMHLKSHVDLFRKAPSQWDQAFQLYSGLVFAQGA